ncbi:hypothetical protein SAMN05421751_107205 [Jhaorihella thermophila]|uniref:AMP nucleosidase n=1 Tax=Jhaorihella thermophila TaxID=488547 RepID=A0A1H5WD20_9RHOB|nr:hypothetical protein SAMN05421751_107205 [Jhaorihella thermophila]
MTDRATKPQAKPAPAPPERRQTDLPWKSPKPGREDPEAPALIRALMESPEYRQADRDVAFLQQDATRGVRLQLDYQKAETLLERAGIEHSIVVFGSTRIPEPRAARERAEEARARLELTPHDSQAARCLRVAERILDKSRYYDEARAFGRIVGQVSHETGGRLVLVTGGGPGMMEAANRGAHDAGAPTVGLNITLPHEQYPNPYLTPGLCFSFHYFAIRKLHFLLRARALVMFPGGYGTMDEMFEALTLIQTRKIAPVPVVLVGREFWCRAFDPDFLVEEGVIDPEDRDLFWYAETAQEAWDDICTWYRRSGRPLVEDAAR